MSPPPDWDTLYREAEGGLFGDEPNAWLAAAFNRPDFAPRTALAIADGDGRNGTFLASRGLDVTAIDLSAEATRRARARDEAAGVRAERIVADLREWRSDRQFDLVAIFYLQGPVSLRRACVELGIRQLAPGGWLILEAFGRHCWPGGRPGASAPEHRYGLDELRPWTAGVDVVEALEGQIALSEGRRHEGEASIVRLLARR